VSTLQGGGRRGHRVDAEAAAGGHLLAVPVALRGRDGGSRFETGQPGGPAFTLRTPGGGSSYPMIAHALTAEGADASEDGTGRGTPLVPVFAPLTAGTPAGPEVNAAGRRMEDDWNLASAGQAVRRLTPRECERLQGFPDDWTLRLADGSEQSDSARYRELGNAVAVPVAAWITRRLATAEAACAARSTIEGRTAA
jgi:DNA (cytosine-5)-methyltransferase 1